jgi:hypothetical protein
MEILASARKHGVADEDIRHALAHAVRWLDLDDGLVMAVGPSQAGRLLEIGVVTAEDDEPLIVHAMPARPKYL